MAKELGTADSLDDVSRVLGERLAMGVQLETQVQLLTQQLADKEGRLQLVTSERDEAISNTVNGLDHQVLTLYRAPNGFGLTLLGRIEALADKCARAYNRIERQDQRITALRGQVAAIRGALVRLRNIGGTVPAIPGGEPDLRGGQPFREEVPCYQIVERALADDAGIPQAAVITAARVLKDVLPPFPDEDLDPEDEIVVTAAVALIEAFQLMDGEQPSTLDPPLSRSRSVRSTPRRWLVCWLDGQTSVCTTVTPPHWDGRYWRHPYPCEAVSQWGHPRSAPDGSVCGEHLKPKQGPVDVTEWWNAHHP